MVLMDVKRLILQFQLKFHQKNYMKKLQKFVKLMLMNYYYGHVIQHQIEFFFQQHKDLNQKFYLLIIKKVMKILKFIQILKVVEFMYFSIMDFHFKKLELIHFQLINLHH